jgi:hypothetical protein
MILSMMNDTSLTDTIPPLQGLMVCCFKRWTVSMGWVFCAYSAKSEILLRPERVSYHEAGQRPAGAELNT